MIKGRKWNLTRVVAANQKAIDEAIAELNERNFRVVIVTHVPQKILAQGFPTQGVEPTYDSDYVIIVGEHVGLSFQS